MSCIGEKIEENAPPVIVEEFKKQPRSDTQQSEVSEPKACSSKPLTGMSKFFVKRKSSSSSSTSKIEQQEKDELDEHEKTENLGASSVVLEPGPKKSMQCLVKMEDPDTLKPEEPLIANKCEENLVVDKTTEEMAECKLTKPVSVKKPKHVPKPPEKLSVLLARKLFAEKLRKFRCQHEAQSEKFKRDVRATRESSLNENFPLLPVPEEFKDVEEKKVNAYDEGTTSSHLQPEEIVQTSAQNPTVASQTSLQQHQFEINKLTIAADSYIDKEDAEENLGG